MLNKIKIERRKNPNFKDVATPLYAVLNINREKIRVPLGMYATDAEWDPVNERIKGRSKDVSDRNLIISQAVSKITDILVRARLSGEKLTRRSFRAAYNSPSDNGSFTSFARKHLDATKSGLQWATQRQHKAVLKKIDQFSPGIGISEITIDYLKAFTTYLRDKMGNNPNTIQKNISVLRVYFQAAINAGLANGNPFSGLKLIKQDPVKIFLTEEELDKLTILYKSGELPYNQQGALRFFLFMTFTGMHITDARNLNIEQIFGGEIHYRRQKNRAEVRVPISQPAGKLIEYYKGNRKRGPLLVGLPTDQDFNRLIKKACATVGIEKQISAKAGRHTFATLYYKHNKGDIGTLSRLLGHTNIETTMVYTHITKEDRISGMAAFDGML
ncbi:MAG: site-specific integrase [Duncaniella sp.]|nr:site-specific integrase [Duncaniella sp.]